MRAVVFVALWAVLVGPASAFTWSTSSGVAWGAASGGAAGSAAPGAPPAAGAWNWAKNSGEWNYRKDFPYDASDKVKVVPKARVPVPWANVAKAAAKAAPIIGTAIVIAEVYDLIRCREGFGGGAECDAGTPEQSYSDKTWFRDSNTGPFASPVTAAQHGSCSSPDIVCGPATVSAEYPLGQRTVYANGQPPGKTYANAVGVHVTWTYTNYGGDPRRVLSTGQANVYPLGVTDTNIRCPSIVVGGGTMTPVKGVDGKCPTGTYGPEAEASLADKIQTYGNPEKAPQMVEAMAPTIPVETGPPQVTEVTAPVPPPHPFYSPGTLGGSVKVHDRREVTQPFADSVLDLPRTVTDWYTTISPKPSTPAGPAIGVTTTIRTTSLPGTAPIPDPDSAASPPATPASGTTGTETTSDKVEFNMCGLPNTPKCKIDETGTVEAPADDFFGKPAEWFAPILEKFSDPDTADTNWTWSFQLPSSCSGFAIPSMAGVALPPIDVCQWQSIIHDIMSLVWIGATIWFCVGIVGRVLGTA